MDAGLPSATDAVADLDAPSPVAGILPDVSMVDFPGRMAAVVFTGGCNFRCAFCHNAAALAGPAQPGMPWRELDRALQRFKANWVDAVVVSGGEPTLHPQLPALVRFLKNHGFAVKLDSNGSNPNLLRALLPELAYVAMDIKCAPVDYPRRTGFDNLAAIDESIHLLLSSARDYEFRTTVLPDWQPPESWSAIASWISGAKRYVLQAFIPRPEVLSPALRTAPETPLAYLKQMQAALLKLLPTVQLRGTF